MGRTFRPTRGRPLASSARRTTAVQPMTVDEFIAEVTSGQNAPPAYFSYDASRNREIHDMLDEAATPAASSLSDVTAHVARGGVVLDTRDPVDFAAGHLAGSLNVGLAGRFSEFAGGVIDPAAPIILVTDPGYELESKNRLRPRRVRQRHRMSPSIGRDVVLAGPTVAADRRGSAGRAASRCN